MCIRDRGERLWQSYAGKVAAMTGDLRGLADHLSRFQAAPRDDTSDCEVCEAGLTARFMPVSYTHLDVSKRQAEGYRVRPRGGHQGHGGLGRGTVLAVHRLPQLRDQQGVITGAALKRAGEAVWVHSVPKFKQLKPIFMAQGRLLICTGYASEMCIRDRYSSAKRISRPSASFMSGYAALSR